MRFHKITPQFNLLESLAELALKQEIWSSQIWKAAAKLDLHDRVTVRCLADHAINKARGYQVETNQAIDLLP